MRQYRGASSEVDGRSRFVRMASPEGVDERCDAYTHAPPPRCRRCAELDQPTPQASRSCDRAAQGARGLGALSAEGPGPFVTSELLRRPDGALVRWRSRGRLKAGATPTVPGRLPDARSRNLFLVAPQTEGMVDERPICPRFAGASVAAVASQWALQPTPLSDRRDVLRRFAPVHLRRLLTVRRGDHAGAGPVPHARHVHWRPVSWEPRRSCCRPRSFSWRATSSSTRYTLHRDGQRLTGERARMRIGFTRFLLSSELAYAEACDRWFGLGDGSLSWRIVALNLLSADRLWGGGRSASPVEPSSGEPVSARIANGGRHWEDCAF